MSDIEAAAPPSNRQSGRYEAFPVWPVVLHPFDRREALTVAEAAQIANRSKRTVRDWALLHLLGRRIAGRWIISRVPVAMFLDGDRDALSRYLDGDREAPAVTGYFERLGIPLAPRRTG